MIVILIPAFLLSKTTLLVGLFLVPCCFWAKKTIVIPASSSSRKDDVDYVDAPVPVVLVLLLLNAEI